MKYLIILFAAIILCNSHKHHAKWLKFKLKHDKTYDNSEEEMERFDIFKENLQLVEEHNKQADLGHFPYRLAINQFADMSHDEFQETLKISKDLTPSLNLKVRLLKARTVPTSVDWREKGVVTEVKDQGRCSACWAFSAVASIESAHAIKTGKLVSLSEQNLIDCDTESEGCSGGLMTSAFAYTKKHPLMTEKDYPFAEYTDTCSYNRSKGNVSITGYYSLPRGNEATLKTAVVKQPISVGIDASRTMQLYGSGILDDKTCGSSIDDINHGVLVVGYGTQDGHDYWLAKNAWGSSWGENGYIKMSRNKKNQCGIASLASYPTV